VVLNKISDATNKNLIRFDEPHPYPKEVSLTVLN